MHALLVLRVISFKMVNYIIKQKLTSVLVLLILLDMQQLTLMPLKISVLHTSY
jgi:hypothetical protein